jgi:hypothetical protein
MGLHVARRLRDLCVDLQHATVTLPNALQRGPTIEELAHHLDVRAEQIRQARLCGAGYTHYRARDLTTEACLRWDLPHLVSRSALVVIELVINAADHAHRHDTAAEARLAVFAVFDGVRAEPVLRRDQHPDKAAGYGLVLV